MLENIPLRDRLSYRCRLRSLLEQLSLLDEAKDRFVDKAFAATLGPNWKDEYGDDVNGYDVNAIKKFVNSSAVDKCKINWQQKPDTLYSAILDAYDDYMDKGGSLSARAKATKENPLTLFEKAPLDVVHEGDDCSDKDLVILDSLENDTFLFVTPLTYKANVWLKGWDCGDQRAEWCLGWEDNDDYWNEHVEDGDLFVMAFNKKEFANPSGEPNKLKFMVELAPVTDSKTPRALQIWLQTDKADETLKGARAERLVGHSFNELASAVVQAVGSDSNDYTESYGWAENWGDQYEEVMNAGGDLSYYDENDLSSDRIVMENFVGKPAEEIASFIQNDKVTFDFKSDDGYGSADFSTYKGAHFDSDGDLVACKDREEFNLAELLSSLLVRNHNIDQVYIDGLATLSNPVVIDGHNLYRLKRISFKEAGAQSIDSLVVTKDFLDKYGSNVTIEVPEVNNSIGKLVLRDMSADEAAKYLNAPALKNGHCADISNIFIENNGQRKLLSFAEKAKRLWPEYRWRQ